MIRNLRNTVWVFDLDDTLLSNKQIIDQMLENLTSLIMQKLLKNRDAANRLRDCLKEKYGSTILGLNAEYGIPIDALMETTHQLSYDKYISRDSNLIQLVKSLKGEKVVFSNGPRSHVTSSITALGIKNLISEVVSCEDFNYKFKPSMESFMRLTQSTIVVKAQTIYMVDDQPKNLETAKLFGFKTIQVGKKEYKGEFDLKLGTIDELLDQLI